MAAAALAGAACGCAYRVRRGPWHPVLTHFGLNLVHFLFFAYPFARP
jgi:membrane protease YdiL (CAAX protease family)